MTAQLHIGVLGATGMLGHHAATAAIAAGHRVTVFHRAGSDLSRISDLAANHAVADLNDRPSLTAAFSTVDAVIHAAAYYPTAPRPLREEIARADAEIERFLGAARESGVGKAVYVGGSIALRPACGDAIGDETRDYPEPPASNNAYVQTKWLMDKRVVTAGRLGLPVCVAIPSMTFGEYDFGPSTGQLITRLANGNLPAYVRGRRNVIYAGDAGRGIVATVERGRAGERYLLTGQNTDMDTLIAEIAALTCQPMPKRLPLRLAKLTAGVQAARYRMFGGALPNLSSTAIAVMSAGQHLSGAKARAELGFEADHSAKSAMLRAHAWFRTQGYCS